jgi:tetraacyldisaccharide 4'-kinase
MKDKCVSVSVSMGGQTVHYKKTRMPDIISSLFFLGRPFSPLYSLFMQVRSHMYSKGSLKSQKMDVPVVSVGNLTMGGTGKTPIVRYIARLLEKNRYKPAIISRGYGGKANRKVNVVSDGRTVYLDAGQAGDEPLLLAESLPGIPVITGVVRSFPCRFAIENFGSDILILDDGFQHLSVFRDLDLVLFNASTLAGNHRVFPGGELREPFSALARAHAFLLTGITDALKPQTEGFGRFLQENFPDRPVFVSTYTPLGCREKNSLAPLSLDSLPSPLHGFCGIAEPSRFQDTLVNCGLQLSGFTALKDHQSYSPELLEKIVGFAKTAGAMGLITTEKDMVKLHTLSSPLPIFSLSMAVDINETFSDFLLRKL